MATGCSRFRIWARTPTRSTSRWRPCCTSPRPIPTCRSRASGHGLGAGPNSGAGGLPAAVPRPRRPALRTAVRAAHGPLHGARPRAGRCGDRRLRRDLGPARSSAARILPSRGRSQLAVGHQARRAAARAGRRDPRSHQRAMVVRVLDRFDEHVAPRYPQLRAQVVHSDLALDNVLLDERGFVTGIVDFGDIVHTSLLTDLVAAMASVLRGREVRRTCFAAGGCSWTATSRSRRSIRSSSSWSAISSPRGWPRSSRVSAWRVLRYPENAEYIQALGHRHLADDRAVRRDGAGRVRRRRSARPRPRCPTPSSPSAAGAALGPAITPPTYARPVHVSRGQGAWLFEADGRRVLDAYNNVPVVGHCHPRVTEAVVRQTRALNTHARYLYEPLIELGERLIASMPDGLGLDTVMLVNSGSEANDIAWRIALAATGNGGGLVTDFAYHGVTTVIADMSPEEWLDGYRPDYVETLGDLTGAARRAGDRAAGRPRAGAGGVYLDTGFTSDGFLEPDAGRRRGDRRRRACRRRPGGGRRGAGRPRPHRRAPVVVRELWPATRLRDDGQADGQRLSGRGAGHRAATCSSGSPRRPSSSAPSAATRWRRRPPSRCWT